MNLHMIVQEAIDKLKTMDPDAILLSLDHEHPITVVNDIYEDEEGDVVIEYR